MTPDEIKKFIETKYPDIFCKRLKRSWSLWYREPTSRPGYSTRIARAVRSRDGSARFKLSVTSLLLGKDDVWSVTSKSELQRLFDRELRLWKENWG